MNTEGSFRCNCRHGYTLSTDGTYCTGEYMYNPSVCLSIMLLITCIKVKDIIRLNCIYSFTPSTELMVLVNILIRVPLEFIFSVFRLMYVQWTIDIILFMSGIQWPCTVCCEDYYKSLLLARLLSDLSNFTHILPGVTNQSTFCYFQFLISLFKVTRNVDFFPHHTVNCNYFFGHHNSFNHFTLTLDISDSQLLYEIVDAQDPARSQNTFLILYHGFW